MHDNAELINSFYRAFAERDHETMAACYASDAVFSDPAFPDLVGPRIGGMWRMLCTRAEDLTITFSDVTADDGAGSAHWEAIYSFGATGRKVHNRIDATFAFKDGLIQRHTDVFDFARWSRMALGLSGLLLGRTGLLRRKVQKQANAQLDRFLAKEAAATA